MPLTSLAEVFMSVAWFLGLASLLALAGGCGPSLSLEPRMPWTMGAYRSNSRPNASRSPRRSPSTSPFSTSAAADPAATPPTPCKAALTGKHPSRRAGPTAR